MRNPEKPCLIVCWRRLGAVLSLEVVFEVSRMLL
jgi:hypothetical protein